jgi:acetylornithine aminotransferase/acetylornithine/N-succinyldiaminopimelate aminotransferase
MGNANKELAARSDQVFIGTYTRYPAAMVKGAGCQLIDAEGKEYLDFLAGIAVCGLGHCHPAVTAAICKQAGELTHVSNLYYTEPQTELAELLTAHSFADRVFLANSGAEANEAAIKLARIWAGEDRYEIISLTGSFHGRTLATVAATGQVKFQKGFEPMPAGFSHAPFGNLVVLEAMITNQTCAILCEPLQGEGGVRPLDREYLQGLRRLCDKYNLLLIFDEIQTGMGRTGTLFAYEQLEIVPNIMTLAKALGNGLPIGAMVTTKRIAAAFIPGSHASTFGGNPVASAAAVATMKVMLADGFLAEVHAKGQYLQEQLQALAARFPALATEARGLGLIQALVLTKAGVEKGGAIVTRMFEKGCLINFAGNVVLRFLPPLIVSREEIDQMVQLLAEVFGEI